MRTPSEDRYFEWLCGIVGLDSDYPCYSKLARILADFPFYSVIPRDIHRAKDGERLRVDYAENHYIEESDYRKICSKNCSYLEMLTALSIRMSELTVDGDDGGFAVKKFFWELLANAGLNYFSDENWSWETSPEVIKETLKMISERGFRYDGVGGFFPLREPKIDQRTIEIWYQMSAFLNENYSVFEG